jgi:hypothetical protein
MIKKKATRVGKKAAKKTAKKKSGTKKHKDAAQVREEIANVVKSGAMEITEAVMGQAIAGNLLPAKYLFEVAKIFPEVHDGKQATQEEDCLAKTLLDRIDRPQKPLEKDEDESSHPTKIAVSGAPSEDVVEKKPDEVKADGVEGSEGESKS